VELCAVVEDIGVVGVVLDGKLEVTSGLVALGCESWISEMFGKQCQAIGLLCSRCMLARLT